MYGLWAITSHILAVLSLVASGMAQGATDTPCLSSALDWYTDVVGETPCTTYQRLRQLCDSSYEVGAFRNQTPGDNCNSQLSACCCNSVSFALSMLCFNCQFTTASEVNGYDAGNGAYGLYLDGCHPVLNQTIPAEVEEAVCQKQVNLPQWLYNLDWTSTGAWFYTYTKDTATLAFNSGQTKNFTNCPTQPSAALSSSSTSPTSLSSTSNDTINGGPLQDNASSSSGSHTSAGAIAGGIIGALLAFSLIGAGVYFFLTRRNREQDGRRSVLPPRMAQMPRHEVLGHDLAAGDVGRYPAVVPGMMFAGGTRFQEEPYAGVAENPFMNELPSPTHSAFPPPSDISYVTGNEPFSSDHNHTNHPQQSPNSTTESPDSPPSASGFNPNLLVRTLPVPPPLRPPRFDYYVQPHHGEGREDVPPPPPPRYSGHGPPPPRK